MPFWVSGPRSLQRLGKTGFHFELEATGATFDMEGRISSTQWDDDDDTGWQDSDDPDNITLSLSFVDLIPGDSREFYVQLRNTGSADAYLSAATSSVGWSGDLACYGGSGAEVAAAAEDDLIVDISEIEGGSATGAHLLSLVVPADWPNGCQGAEGTWVVSLNYTTDAP